MRKFKNITAIMILIYSLTGFCDIPDQVNLHYTANVVNRPCTISIPKTTYLDLGDVDGNSMNTTGSVTPWVHETVLFTQCDIETNIVVYASDSNFSFVPGSFAAYSFDEDKKPQQLAEISLLAYTVINGIDVNMYKYYKRAYQLVITPIQRRESKYTSYTLPLKFRFIKNDFKGHLIEVGDVFGVFIMTVEYK